MLKETTISPVNGVEAKLKEVEDEEGRVDTEMEARMLDAGG